MFHLEILRAFERERLTLKLAVRTYWNFKVFRERIIQRQTVVSHNHPVTVTAIIDLDFKNLVPGIIVNYHISKL
jgi:hypothetical protein